MVGELAEVEVLLDAASRVLHEGEDFAREALEGLESVFAGSGRDDVRECLAAYALVLTEMGEMRELLSGVRASVVRVRATTARLVGDGGGPAARAEREPPPVVARDGTRYPEQARWCVGELPPRVRPGAGDRTVGHVVDVPAPFTSGDDGTWGPAVRERMAALGIRTRMRIYQHVEMKVAMMMVGTGRRSVALVINNAPCGSQPGQVALGCHQALERFLPEGSELVVHGSTSAGEPCSWAYRGKA
ncbi:hypothetical protein GCM10010428_39070 [Actinosynnema pretiosum subsp. pretiosum]